MVDGAAWANAKKIGDRPIKYIRNWDYTSTNWGVCSFMKPLVFNIHMLSLFCVLCLARIVFRECANSVQRGHPCNSVIFSRSLYGL